MVRTRSTWRAGQAQAEGLFQRLLHQYVIPDPNLVILVDQRGAAAEVVDYSERHHFIWLLTKVWRWAVVAVIAHAVALTMADPTIATVAGGVAAATNLVILVRALDWNITRIIVTNRRLLRVGGVFNVAIGNMPHSKLTDLSFQQSFPGRVFQYGKIRVESAGQDQALNSLDVVRQPYQLYQAIGRRAFN